ncbi:MAG: hypothetical protein RIS26_220 [Actinomycetota bacterium]|jgi:hypothetical protein
MNIVYFVITAALTVPLAKVFWGAGNFKRTAPVNALVAAGMGWAAKTPVPVIRLIAILEILGVVGLVLGQAAAWLPAFEWVGYVGAAAAFGLALTMVGAAILHIARKEIKYTWTKNVGLGAVAAIAGVTLLLAIAA